MITNKEFVEKLKNIATNYKTLYVMGCFGAPMNAANKKKYCNNHAYNKQPSRTAMINAATDDTFGFDCVCLIKGVLWGWNGDKTKSYGGSNYTTNGVPDINADTMITKCNNISTDFSKIEVGEAVWMKGHIGVYIGDGLAVECTPSWANCVQITACNCSKSGYNRRNWTKHGKLPYITYDNSINTPQVNEGSKPTPSSTLKYKVGDVVNFTGTKHYSSARANTGSSVKPSKAKITEVSENGKHPYHCCAVDDSGKFVSGVYGWVDVSDISSIKSWTPVVGDVVNYVGNIHYGSANATQGTSCKGGKAIITSIYQLGKSKHPYHLKRISGGDSTVYGWVDVGTFSKI